MWYNESDPALVRSPGQHHNPTRKGAAMPGESSKKIELARRATNCKQWRWMPGMRGIASEHASFRVGDDGRRDDKYGKPVGLPDLDDPATLGCIEHELVPAAWGGATIKVDVDMTMAGWYARVEVWSGNFGDPVLAIFERRASERFAATAEALVAALEAAPS